jgi:cytochrome b6-f complex iron-sulfur subunit
LTCAEPAAEWFERSLDVRIPIVYQKGSGEGKGHTDHALGRLRRLQSYIGFAMLMSAAAGVYLLDTDGSLWHLAVSHAVGLVIIVVLDVSLGVMNLLGSRRVYIASLAAAVLGIVLQLGDVTTAPQYNMTVAYFASYLFGLGAFDALLLLQGMVIVLGIFGRGNLQFLASKRRVAKELNYTRRSFVTTMAGFGVLIGLGVALGSVKLPAAPSGSNSTSSTAIASSSTGIANTNDLQVGSPVYFDYPSGYPNVLFKRSDGSLAAYSLLCTHVCCEVSYESSTGGFFCPCHGSEFNSEGQVTRGPAGSPLPSVTLSVDNAGNVFPTGVSGHSPC